jgi:LytS/YehU family sensor histidine kinase
LKQLYVEAAILCLVGLLGATAVLGLSGAAAGLGVKFVRRVAVFETACIVPAFLAWTSAYFLVDGRRRELARLRATADIREASFKARNALLRQQINPHFLFNALNALYTLILDSDRERALGVIGAIQRFVERALDPAHGELVPLSSELAIQDAYLDIERARFGARLLVEQRVAAEVEAARVPHLILQPLVENAVKYGVARTESPVTVEITAARAGEELVLQVKDSGAVDADARPPGLGVGLKNVEGRLRSLYGDAGRLACSPLDPAGFLAEVRVPLVF